MEISEKVAYLKGLAEGLALDTETKEGKLIAAIIDVLDEMSIRFEDIDDNLVDLEDGLDAVSDDLSEVEEALYEMDNDDEELDDDAEYFETTCPVCQEEIVFDEDTLDSGEIRCPNCGEKLEFDLSDLARAEDDYNDGDLYYFMDQETYDMVPLNRDMLGDAFRFVKENTMCMILSIKGNVFGVEPPNFVDLEVTETEPGLAGNTATNTLKPATLETGAQIKVPLFVNIGDKITIDTRTGEYIGRAK